MGNHVIEATYNPNMFILYQCNGVKDFSTFIENHKFHFNSDESK